MSAASSPDTRPRVRALVAPDAFKGTFAATDVARAIASGLERAGIRAVACPVADGGEGTLDVLLEARGGRIVETTVHDPIGRRIRAKFALLGEVDDRVAVIEVARAIGLDKVSERERDPWLASSFGAGQLIVAAADAGAREILVAVGGSATVDGGRGALEAIERRGGVPGVRLVVLCDVETPWERCAAVYGPQKGADEAMVERLALRLDGLAGSLARDPRGVPRTGAAGGISGALWANYGARLDSGAEHILSACDFRSRMPQADCVVVGEGRIDEQSLDGKIVGEIARRARAANVEVHAIVGKSAISHADATRLGIASVREATTLAAIERSGSELAAAIGT